jgi:hypothetical protein
MLSGTSLTAGAGRSGSQSQWPAGGRRDHTAIVAARPVPGMQRIRAMVKGVHAVELAPGGKRPVPGRRDPARQARFQGRRIRYARLGSHRWPKPAGYRWNILRADVRTLLRLHAEALKFRRNATGSG